MSRNGRIIGSNPDDWGSLPAWIVARLSGLSRQRLAAWSRTGLIVADHGREDSSEKFYTWYQFERARIAAKLIEHGLPPRKVRPCLDILDASYRDWLAESLCWIEVKRHRLELDGRAVDWDTTDMPPPDAIDFLTSGAPEQRIVREAWRCLLPSSANLDCIIEELFEQSPLGVLHDFNDRIDMVRGRLGASPCLADTRMGVEFFLNFSVEELLSGWDDLSSQEAQALVDFAQALLSPALEHAAVA